MPSLKILLRTLLVFVLCANGALSAWAATSMAVEQAGHVQTGMAGAHAAAAAKAAADCGKNGTAAAGQPGKQDKAQHDCDCTSQACCDCVLTFFTGGGTALFAAQHPLSYLYVALRPVQPVLGDISPVFRPPIG